MSKGLDPYRYTTPIQGLSIPGTSLLPSIGYPPLWPFIAAAIYDVYSLIGIESRFLYYFLLKQPMILGDVVAAFLIYKIVRNGVDLRSAERAFSFWMFCPFIIIISSIWGMFDQLVLVFVLAALVLLHRTLRGSVTEFVSIILKGFPVVFLPVLSMGQITTRRRLAYFILASGLALLFTLAPYSIFRGWNIAGLYGTGIDIVNKAANSINYGVVVFFLSSLSLIPQNWEPYWRLVGYAWVPAIVASYIFCFRNLKRERISAQYMVRALLFVTLVYFLTRLNLNEQFVVYFLGFGLIDISWGGSRRSRLFAGVWVSALVFLIANNTYMVRFLAPVSGYFTELNNVLTSGGLQYVRFGLMVAAGLAFTIFCVKYIASLYSELKAYKGSAAPVS